jgi:peptidyl-prolyl isomerase E (cyclophilin E)
MEEGGNKTKKTIFIGGIGEDVDEEVILEAFSVFGEPRWQGCLPCLTVLFLGDVIDVQLPTNATGRPHENRVSTPEKLIVTFAH